MKAETGLNKSAEQIVSCNTPLFALHTWLYPGIPLQLQVFEPRYLDMVTRQLKKGEGFGVVAIRAGREVGAPADVFPLGVKVKLTDWRQQANGLLGITVEGEERFRILETETQADGLLLAATEKLPDLPGVTITEDVEGLLQLLEQLKQHQSIQAMQLPAVTDTVSLSWQLAHVLPLSSTEKMALLALSDPEERLDCLARKINSFSAQ